VSLNVDRLTLGGFMTSDVMKSFGLQDLLSQHEATGKLWMEFLRVPALSAGIYRLTAGSLDPQKPHSEDEIYYVISGSGSFTCDGQTIDAVAGDIMYVAAHAEHSFHDITDALTILVIFAPAEVE